MKARAQRVLRAAKALLKSCFLGLIAPEKPNYKRVYIKPGVRSPRTPASIDAPPCLTLTKGRAVSGAGEEIFAGSSCTPITAGLAGLAALGTSYGDAELA